MFTMTINGKGQEMFILFIKARMTCMPNYSNSFQFDNINHDNNVFILKTNKNQFLFRPQCCSSKESSKHLKQDKTHVRS